MPETNDIQKQTDVEMAKAKLQEVQETKEGRMDPRAGERTMLPARTRTSTDEKDIRPIQGKPKKKKFGQRLKEAVFGEEVGKGSISEFLFFKLLIPNAKKLISDMCNTAINMALGLDPKTRTVGNTHTSNASLYRDRNYNRTEPAYSRRDAVSEYEWSEEDAKDIYSQIAEIIDRYGECSLADAYSIMGMGDKIRTTDRNWGWTSMRNADIVPVDRTGDRWVVDMPSARPLK